MRSIVFRSCWLAMSGVVAVTGAIAACSGGNPASRGDSIPSEPDSTSPQEPGASAVTLQGGRGVRELAPGADPIEGIEPSTLPRLVTAPTFDSSSGLLTVTMTPGELGMISLDPTLNVLVNGQPVIDSAASPSVQATSTTVTSVSVVEPASDATSTTLTTELILDYSNGIFAAGLSGSTGSVTLAFTGNEPTILGIKGTNTADAINFGANGVAFNADAYMDVVFGGSAPNGGIGTFVVSMGNGDDTWSAGGNSVTGGVFANSSPANPASGYGPGVVVYGGLGNDTFLEGTAVTPYETLYGGGQAGDTVDYSARSAGVNVTLGLAGVASAISGHCGVPGDAGPAPGAGCVTDEFDDIKNDVFIVNGSSGNDFLTASPSALAGGAGGGGDAGASDAGHADAASDASHSDAASDAGSGDAGHADAGSDAGGGTPIVLTFNAGAGDDMITPYGGPYLMKGGAGNDTFVMGGESNPHGTGTLQGGAGVDYIDFSARTAALAIDMTGATLSGEAGEGVTITNDIENLHAGSGNDTILGNSLDNVINGGLGADVMSGNGGTDTVDYSDRAGPVYVTLDNVAHSGAGSFTQVPAVSAPYTSGACTFTSSSEMDQVSFDFSNVIGSQGADCLYGQPAGVSADCVSITTGNNPGGNTCQNTLTGGPGNDMLFGYDQDDILEGSGGVGGDSNGASNYLDCGGGFANVGHDIGSGYKANCQF